MCQVDYFGVDVVDVPAGVCQDLVVDFQGVGLDTDVVDVVGLVKNYDCVLGQVFKE